MQKSFFHPAFLLTLILLVIASCNTKTERFAIDERSLPAITLTYKDYASALFLADTSNLAEHLKKIQPDFLPFLNASLDDTAGIRKLKNFAGDTLARRMFGRTQQVFASQTGWKSMLEASFRRFHYFFPAIPIPVIYTFVSNVQPDQAVMAGPNELLIALDCFLGYDEPAYGRLGIPRYMAVRMTPEHLGPAVWAAMYEAHVEDKVLRTRVLDEMIASGRKYLFIEAMLPDVPDHVLFGVEAGKLRWLQQHEGEIWTALISEGLLYSTDPTAFRKLFADGPFTADFSYDAPARIGEWVGWQIMRSYAQQQPNKRLADILISGDAQSILSASRYKPR
ncbi:MAG TPA: hypothetical protein PKE03_05560 [Bacteroidales bacterium]|nr:hypothetical protein [Bacteroidales bacterium]